MSFISKQKDPSFLYTVLFKRYDGLIDLLKSRECVVDAREKSSPQDVAVGLSPSMVEVSYSFDLGTLADSLNAQLSHDVMVEASKISGSYALEHPHHASRFPGTVSPASKGLALLIERAVYTLSKKEFAHVQSLYEKK